MRAVGVEPLPSLLPAIPVHIQRGHVAKRTHRYETVRVIGVLSRLIYMPTAGEVRIQLLISVPVLYPSGSISGGINILLDKVMVDLWVQQNLKIAFRSKLQRRRSISDP